MSWFGKLKEKVRQTVDTVKEATQFERIRSGLSKTRNSLLSKLENVLRPGGKIDEQLFEELEGILITADIGIDATAEILERVKKRVKAEKIEDSSELFRILRDEMLAVFEDLYRDHQFLEERIHQGTKPFVLLIVGVNGVGKTTTIGKLAYRFRQSGYSVLIGAADTFRAAASEQLEIWAKRAAVDIIQQEHGADPAAVAFDTLQAAQHRNIDVVLIDTAGRLHNKEGLMRELEKITRVLKKLKSSAPDDVLLVLDATIGQNALQQAKVFREFVPVTGLVLTKLDGTAKGGVVFTIAQQLRLPVEYIGVGESLEDLQPFHPEHFVGALFQKSEVSVQN